ncbi:MAG: diguanylate cyclase [Clostridiales bacterium]|nr:diguanylate cyclase [Clostridiales bacterium]
MSKNENNNYINVKKKKGNIINIIFILISVFFVITLFLLNQYVSATTWKLIEYITIVLLYVLAVVFLFLLKNMNKNRKLINDEKQTYQALLNEMQQGLALHEIITDENNKPIDYRYLGVNPKFESMLGIRAEEIIGKTVLEVFPATEKIWITEYGEVALTGKAKKVKNYFSTTNKYYEVYAYSPRIGQFATLIYDVTDSKVAAKQLYEEKALLKTTLISVGDGVITTDRYQRITLINKVAQLLTGYSLKEAKGKLLLEVFQPITETTKVCCKDKIRNIYSKGQPHEFTENILLVSKNGIEFPIEGIITPIKESSGVINGAVVVFRDYSERKEKQDKIEYLSFHDKLTGLYNRRFFDEECLRLDTKRNYPLSVVMADVNGLKLLNDAYGHVSGDELLITFATILKEHMRADDIVSRVGGDEFVLLLPSTKEEEANEIINRIKEKLSTKRICNIPISVAFGCHTKTEEKTEFSMIYQQAEINMYKNKLKESESLKKEVVGEIIKELHNKFPKEKAHSKEVATLCEKFGKVLELNETEINKLYQLGYYHNIGNISNLNNSLSKKTKTNKELYTETAYQILRSVNEYADISNIVLQHNERWDGLGLPRGLYKEKITIQARILAIVNAYNNMIIGKGIKQLSKEKALLQIHKDSKTLYDPTLVDIFINKVI